jgi:hypothetical protein
MGNRDVACFFGRTPSREQIVNGPEPSSVGKTFGAVPL